MATKLPTGISKLISDNVGLDVFESHEKYPFLMEMAGAPGWRGGFCARILSSLKSSSSMRCSETFALTA
jgi:hypothetical protein